MACSHTLPIGSQCWGITIREKDPPVNHCKFGLMSLVSYNEFCGLQRICFFGERVLKLPYWIPEIEGNLEQRNDSPPKKDERRLI